jgi:menaquinone-dependent protoporphyrinogen oxidase
LDFCHRLSKSSPPRFTIQHELKDRIKMRVLIAYASRYGATQGIAERVAATLHRQHLAPSVQPVQGPTDPASYDAVIIGSAAYYFHWMKPATNFVQRNSRALAGRPVWLFSSGPLGTRETDDQGRDLREYLEPKEIAAFRTIVQPREHRVFFGAMDSTRLGFTHRLIHKLPANRDNAMFPQGDFRNWPEIDAWANTIVESLKSL